MDTEAAPLVARQPNGRWLKGSSGNPAGRQLGSRNSASDLSDEILMANAEDLTRAAVAMALDGDAAALRLCIDRIVPKRRHRPLNLAWPAIHSLADVDQAMTATLGALGNGQLEVEQASALTAILDAKRRSIAAVEIERRLHCLENRSHDEIDGEIERLQKELSR
jgi:hypothetical protein